MNRELDPLSCQRRVYGARDFWGHQCQKPPVVVSDGKKYCRVHDPQYIQKRDAEKSAAHDLFKCAGKGCWFNFQRDKHYAFCPFCGTKKPTK